MQARILLVEDDPSLGFVIKDNLGLRGYDVVLCRDGEEGHTAFFQQPFHLCLLDVMLPKKDGFTLAREIRRRNREVPILFLTAKSMVEDKLEGFETGADDFITKPFSLEELLCRIDVFLRRSKQELVAEDQDVVLGQYQFNYKNLTLSISPGAVKTLTQKEAEVLRLLYTHRERVLKREEILTSVWGDDDYFMGRSMDVFISRLRKIFKDDESIRIENIPRIGFKLVAP